MRTIDYFLRSAERFPDRDALVDGDRRRTYAELADDVRRISQSLLALGVTRQEKVALYGPNSADIMTCLLGIWHANAVWIPINTRNALDANIAYLNYVRAEWLFYHSSYSAHAAALQAAVPSLTHLICLDRTNGDDPSLADFMLLGEGHATPDNADPFGNLNDLVGLVPTGGTTGPAKGVEVTNLGWGTMIETAMNAWAIGDTPPICLTTAPITHAAGPVAIATMALGATVVILPSFDALAVLEAIERRHVTHMFLPPTALYALLDHPGLGDFDYSSLRIFLLAGAPVAPHKLQRAVAVFGPCICQSYGQTEAPMLVTWLPPQDVAAAASGEQPERLSSCGRPTYSVRVGIMNDHGELLPPGEVGEIVVRGALVSRGYFGLPDATAEVRTHGWHHTGDVGRRDEQGYIYIVDRKKDMVITGGFNVFCAEVEAAVMELMTVRECAVIGLPDEKWGERVTAVIVGQADSLPNEDAIIAHCKVRLGSVKAPKSVYLWPELPRTGAGKVDKKAIRARFSAT